MSSIYSMTGYASASGDVGGALLNLEIKSVNSRFLDIGFRLGEELRAVEMTLRERLAERIARGKLEVRGYLQEQPGAAGGDRHPSAQRMDELARLQEGVQARFPSAPELTVAEILRWPGVMVEPSADPESQQTKVQALFVRALDELVASREREGAKLAAVLIEKIGAIRDHVRDVAPRVPLAIAAYQERLSVKLREAVAALDEDRIRQEIGVFAAKIDVAEELARLATHCDEVERVLKKGGAVGKRLDFLMQELNREANTLASKSVSTEVTAVAMDLKLLIEQMREQVQNLE